MGDYSSDSLSSEGEYLPQSTDGNEDSYIVQASATLKVSQYTSVTLVQRRETVDSDVRDGFTRNSTALSLDRRF
jgi:hypothetical protein